MTRYFPLWLVLCGLTLSGCSPSTNPSPDSDADADSDTDTDGDSDADTDVFATINAVEPEGQNVSFFLYEDDNGKPTNDAELVCENVNGCAITVSEPGIYWVQAERTNYWYVNLPVGIVTNGDEIIVDWTNTGERCVAIDGSYCNEDSWCDLEVYNGLWDLNSDGIDECWIGGDGFYMDGAIQTVTTFDTTYDSGGYNRGTTTEDSRTIHFEVSNGSDSGTHNYTLDQDNRES